MKLKRISVLTLVAILFCCLSSCLKKGEDDPLISFRTRKARVVGKWKIESGTIEYKNFYLASGGYYDQSTLTYFGNTFEQKTESSNSTDVTTGSVIYEIEFKKDGEFISTTVYNNISSTVLKGTWNFTGKVGDRKNKEQIVIHLTSQSYQATGPSAINNNTVTSEGDKVDITYDIKELRNKKLVLVTEFSSENNNGIMYANNSNLTFIQ